MITLQVIKNTILPLNQVVLLKSNYISENRVASMFRVNGYSKSRISKWK
jgi:hypothetical protein